MKKSQQCAVCYGMFESNEGKHERHTQKTNVTPKGTPQKWVCFKCLEAIKK